MLLNKCELKITVYTKDDISKLKGVLKCVSKMTRKVCINKIPH